MPNEPAPESNSGLAAAEGASPPIPAEEYRRRVRAWTMYDWANSAYSTIITAAVFPVYYRSLAQKAGLGNQEATAAWSYTNSAAMLIIALAGPFLGACADAAGLKKRFLALFAGLGILGSASLALVAGEHYLLASALFTLSAIGFAGANIFYESLLPHIARRDELDRISARGYALGYLGGGLLLVLNLAWITNPARFHMPDAGFAVRLSFLTVAMWWLLFSIPLFRHVHEPFVAGQRKLGLPLVAFGFRQVFTTFREAKRYPQLVLFLFAFWIYNDGIATIIKVAVAYGDEIGVQQKDLLLALALTQFVGVPFALAFGRLGGWIGTKNGILLGVAAYALISAFGFFMKTTAHFYALAISVAAVQGGTQALSRSLFASMIPRNEAAKFFGLFSTGEKFAGIIGPFLFAFVGQLAGSSRWGILSVTLLFLVGGLMLAGVNEAKGRRAVDFSAPPRNQ